MGNTTGRSSLVRLWNNCLSTFQISNGVKLWENSSPTSVFAEQTITVPDMSGYKYIVFGYKDDYGSDKVERFIYFKSTTEAGGYNITVIAQDTSLQNIASRYIKVLSSTSIKINNAYVNKTLNNVYLIPTKIYGSNDLGYLGGNDFTENQVQFVKDEYNKTLNLFDKFNIAYGSIYASTGDINNNNSTLHSDYIEIKPNTNYSNNMIGGWGSSGGIAFYDSSKTYISGIASSNSSYNHFTTPSNARFMRISFYIDSSSPQYITDVNTLMLNEGDIVLPYQAYNGAIVHQKDIKFKHNLFITITGTGQQRDWRGRLSLLIENNNTTPITTWQQIYNYMVSKNITKLRASGQIYSNRPINLSWIGYEMSNNQPIINFYGVNMTTYNNDGTGQYEYSLSTDTVIEDVIL